MTTTTTGARSDGDLFRELYPGLLRYAAVVAPPESDHDLIQEAVARVLRRGTLGGLLNADAYLRRTIVNLASNERRRLGRLGRAVRRSRRTDDRSEAYPSDVADLLALSPRNRAVLWLVDIEGYTCEEAARILGCRPEAARARASRSRQALRTHLNEEDHDD